MSESGMVHMEICTGKGVDDIRLRLRWSPNDMELSEEGSSRFLFMGHTDVLGRAYSFKVLTDILRRIMGVASEEK